MTVTMGECRCGAGRRASAAPGPRGPRRSPGRARPRVRPPRQIALIGEIKYLWDTYRLVLLLRPTISKAGVWSFRWRSRRGVLCIAAWFFIVVIILAVIGPGVLERFFRDAKTVLRKAQYATFVVLGISFNFLAFFSLRATSTFCRLTGRWWRMELRYEALTGARPDLGLQFITPLVMFTQLGIIILSVVFTVVYDLNPWDVPSVTHGLACGFALFHIWTSTHVLVGVLASGLARRLADDANRLGADGIRQHRLLWLRLVELMDMFDECWRAGIASLVLAVFVMAIAFGFGCLDSFIHTDLEDLDSQTSVEPLWDAVGSFCVYLCGIITQATMCLCAHYSTNSINVKFRKQLLRLRLVDRSEGFRHEVVAFLEDMTGRRAVVSAFGMICLDRARLVTIFATGVTYLVVMSQFVTM